MSAIGWIVANFFRWLPHRAPTGLFPVGTPDAGSPVIVTANFSLTVARVRRALAGQDLWLLVANSDGINVWCGATGGAFTESRVIDAIKVSGLAEKVGHRDVILPALSAPGVCRAAIRDQTGFRARFGPVYAEDIPAYLEAGQRKTDQMRRFRFDLRHRLDMFLSMNFPVYAAAALALALIRPRYVLGYTLLFWSALAVLYLFINVIPGRTGWKQAALAGTVAVLLWAAFDAVALHDPLRHWGWLIAVYAVFLAGGFDLAGIASARKSDPEQFMIRRRCRRLGSLFLERTAGIISLDADKCVGCGMCREVCPLGVFGEPTRDGKTTLNHPDLCFTCGACVKQCPESALSIRAASTGSTLTK